VVLYGDNMRTELARTISKWLPRPKGIIYEITPRCNLHCRFCYNVWKNGANYPSGEMDTDAARNLLARVVKQSAAKIVTISGGEPFLRSDLPSICAFLRGLKVKVNIVTNGTLCSMEMMRDCVEAGVALFEFPLLASDREIHDSLVGGDAFDKVLDAMANARASGARVVTTFIMTRKNLDFLAETLELNAALRVDGVMLNRFNPGGEGRNHIDELLPNLATVQRALAVAEHAAEKWRLNIACSIPLQPCLIDRKMYPHLSFGDCPWGTRDMYFTIDPIGNLRPCNHSETILGNLHTDDYRQLVKSEKMACLARTTPSRCKGCSDLRRCQGGCKAAAEACYGSACEPEPFLKSNCSQGA